MSVWGIVRGCVGHGNAEIVRMLFDSLIAPAAVQLRALVAVE